MTGELLSQERTDVDQKSKVLESRLQFINTSSDDSGAVDSVEAEKMLLAGLIMSTSFCQKLNRGYKKEFIQSKQIELIIGWVFDYFRRFKKAPGKAIKSIYEINKEKLKEAEAEIVDTLLENVSEDYSDDYTEEYFLDQANAYFEKRGVDILLKKVAHYNLIGESKKAIAEIAKFTNTAQLSSDTFNPLANEEIDAFFIQNKKNRLFKFEGAAGEYLGWFERSWFVSFTAPEKRGKTFTLDEAVVQALKAKLKVFKVSLEMNKVVSQRRIYTRLTALPLMRKRTIVFPVFDCEKNQDGSCEKIERTNDIDLLDAAGKIPEYSPTMKYRPCTYCRDKKINGYEVATWFSIQRRVNALDRETLKRKARGFKTKYGDNFRYKVFPAYSATIEDIEIELDTLEFMEGFVPDVIVIDYIDIFAEENTHRSDQKQIDIAWQKMKKLAAVKNCLVITADQAKASVENKKTMTVNDWSDSKKKNAHVDAKIAINQSGEEEKAKVIRFGYLLHRHMEIDKSKQVFLLQERSLGQIMLDSEIGYVELDEEKSD